MRGFLRLLWVLCATPVQSIFDGTCPRKDPPPGVLILSPGSKLVLTCSGHVKVDGVKISMARNSSNINRRENLSDAIPTTVNIISNSRVSMKSDKHTLENSEGYHSNPTEAGEPRSPQQTDTGYPASPTTHMVQPTSVSRLQKGESNREAEEMDGGADYEEEEEEEEEGARVTRGIKSRHQWKWHGRIVGKGDRDWGEITFERRGASLSLSSVRLTDSGKYTCYYRGRERFSLKVTVADPPENPTLSCHKKSPSSKIRCEWTPQKPFTVRPNCYLLLNKSPTEPFLRLQCSYSSRLSRCWCTVEHNEDEKRIIYMAYLCVTSIAGNATSNLLDFMPLSILKPDPPSHVSVRQEEGWEKKMTVTWRPPTSWNSQNNHYDLTYEVKYKPLTSSVYQTKVTHHQRSYTITDAMPGVEYLIQLRTKEDFDGWWSDWSAPVYASSWTSPVSVMPSNDDLHTPTFPVYISTEGSGTGDYESDVPTTLHIVEAVEVSHHILWISGSFALLLVILAAFILRHKDRFMSKFQSLSVVTQHGDSPQPPPSVPTAPEGQALVTFGAPHYKEPPPSEVKEENEDEQQVKERIEAMHFTNTSYFFLQQW